MFPTSSNTNSLRASKSWTSPLSKIKIEKSYDSYPYNTNFICSNTRNSTKLLTAFNQSHPSRLERNKNLTSLQSWVWSQMTEQEQEEPMAKSSSKLSVEWWDWILKWNRAIREVQQLYLIIIRAKAFRVIDL